MNGTRSTERNTNCYECTGSCVYKAVESIFLLGIIANVLVVILVCKDRKLRAPTYVAIACLALSDAVFLVVNLIESAEVVVRTLTCSFPLSYRGPVVAVIKGICWFAANAHVSVLASVRYVLLIYPLKAHVFLTSRKVILSSAFVWLLGILIWTLPLAVKDAADVDLTKSVVFVTVIWGIVYVMPVVITAFLHVRKWYHVRKMSTRDWSGTGNVHNSALRMTKIILIVIMLALFLPLPKFIYETMTRTQYNFPSRTVSSTFRDVSLLLFLLNHSINPLIYAFMSASFRKSCKSLCYNSTTTNTPYNTSDNEKKTSDTERKTSDTVQHIAQKRAGVTESCF